MVAFGKGLGGSNVSGTRRVTFPVLVMRRVTFSPHTACAAYSEQRATYYIGPREWGKEHGGSFTSPPGGLIMGFVPARPARFSPFPFRLAPLMSRVVLAMSGGVDSSVAAWLLREAGHEVVGLFMRHGQQEPIGLRHARAASRAAAARPTPTTPGASPIGWASPFTS